MNTNDYSGTGKLWVASEGSSHLEISESPSYLGLETESYIDLDAVFSMAILGPQAVRAGAGMRRVGQVVGD